MSKKIAVIGECMIKLSEKNGAVNHDLGGDTLNTSVYIARQTDASALSAHCVTALGTDAFNQQMLDSWQQKSVNTDFIQRMADRLPGLYYIETDDTGERTFYYWRNETAAKFWLESDRAATICEELATFDYFYLGGISLAILSPASRGKLFTLLRECRANGSRVIFDNNYHPRLWAGQAKTQQACQEMLACADIAFLTLDDKDALQGEKPIAEVIVRAHTADVEEVVVKRGADACLVSVSGQPLQEVPAVRLAKEKVVGTTAAGDSFSADYLAVHLTGGDAESAVKRGYLAASTAIQYRGAITPREAMPQ